MFRKKGIAALAFVLVILFLITGCSGGTPTATSNDKAANDNQASKQSTDSTATTGTQQLTQTKADAIVIKFAHTTPLNDRQHKAVEVFKYLAEGWSGGRLKVEIYPNNQLGSEAEVLQSTLLGTIQMTSVTEGVVANRVPEAMVLSIPYRITSPAVGWRVMDGPFGEELKSLFKEKTGSIVLAYGDNGMRSFTNNKRPIKSIEDFKGLKFRTMQNPAHMKMVSALGGDPTPIAWGELYSSLQTGVVDGQEAPPPLIQVMKFYEVQKYMTLDNHLYSPYFLIVNGKFYEGLPEDLKAIIKNAAQVYSTVERGIQERQEFEALAEIQQKGMEIYFPTQEELTAFRQQTEQPVINWMVETLGNRVWVDKFLNAVKEAEQF